MVAAGTLFPRAGWVGKAGAAGGKAVKAVEAVQGFEEVVLALEVEKTPMVAWA
jgi:hypothetical protein